MVTIEELRKRLLDICHEIIGGTRPAGLFIIPSRSDGMATPYIEIHDNEYHFIVNERGRELERKITRDDDEILYWFVESNVSILASTYAAKHCPANKEFRRVYFRRQYELLKSINPKWAEIKRKQFIEILCTHDGE